MKIKNHHLLNTDFYLILKIIPVIYFFVLFHFFQMDMMDSVGQIIQKTFQLSTQQIGLIDSSFFYADFLMIFIAGVSLDWFDPKFLMIFSVIINLIGLLIFLHFHSFETLMLWRVFSGMGMAYSFVSILKIIVAKLENNNYGLAFAITGFAMMPAGVIAHNPTLLFIRKYGLTEFFHIYLIAGLLLIALIYFLLNLDIKQKLSWPDHYKIITPYNMLAALYASLANLPLFILGASFGVDYLVQNYEITTIKAASIVSLLFVGDMFGSMLWGVLFDKLNNARNMLIITGSLVYLFVTLALFIVNWHPIPFLVSILFIILGFATSSQTLVYVNMMKKNSFTHIGKVISLISLLSIGVGAVFENFFSILFKTFVVRQGLIWVLISCLLILISSLMFKINKKSML